MGKYINDSDVLVRLAGKVEVTDNPEDENKMPRTLLRRLIAEAESELELDLSQRYAVPFQTVAGAAFSTFPDSSATKNIIRTCCELKAVSRVLETDFGRGTVVDSEKYRESIDDRYDSIVNDRLLKKRKDKEDTGQWQFPPLQDLALMWGNTEADDGYFGMVLTTSRGDGGYPADQINDPSENWFNGFIVP